MPVDAVTVVHRLIDQVWNGGDLAALPELFTDPFLHSGRQDTVDGLRRWHQDDAATWAEARYQVVDEVTDGTTVAVRWRATARQVGDWGPVAATGREITWEGVHFVTVEGGRITALWALADAFGKARQLGALD